MYDVPTNCVGMEIITLLTLPSVSNASGLIVNVLVFVNLEKGKIESNYSEDNDFVPSTVTIPSPSRHRPVPILSITIPLASLGVHKHPASLSVPNRSFTVLNRSLASQQIVMV